MARTLRLHFSSDTLLQVALCSLDFSPLTIQPATCTIKLYLPLLDFMLTLIQLPGALGLRLSTVELDLGQAPSDLTELAIKFAFLILQLL
ncbi:hypothetical protein D9M68_192970 [compost metagenome]